MLDLFESLFEAVDALERDGIEHALVGGLALADLRTENRLHGKVDMSPAGIARRLREVEQQRRLA